jgi:hypothetical protein
MKKHLLIVLGALGLVVALTSPKASAQMPNMDMSWGMRSQMQLQYQGDLYARMVALQYDNYMLHLRRMGYTGPSLPTGVTSDTLRASTQRLQQSMDGYRASSAANSNRTSYAINDWDNRAIRGCWWTLNVYNQYVMVCP